MAGSLFDPAPVHSGWRAEHFQRSHGGGASGFNSELFEYFLHVLFTVDSVMPRIVAIVRVRLALGIARAEFRLRAP